MLDEENVEIPYWFGLFHLLIMISMLTVYIFYRNQLGKSIQNMDVIHIEPSDYTVWFKNVPDYISESDFKSFLNDEGRDDGEKCQVVKVNFGYKISKRVELQRKL